MINNNRRFASSQRGYISGNSDNVARYQQNIQTHLRNLRENGAGSFYDQTLAHPRQGDLQGAAELAAAAGYHPNTA